MARVLIISVVYPPDRVSTADLVVRLASGLGDSGHVVSVLTSQPHYNPPVGSRPRHRRRFAVSSRAREDGVDIFRCRTPAKGPRPATRMVGFAALHLTMAVTALRHCRHTDVAIVVSPPLTFAAIAQLLRVTSGTRVIYNAQELWPDVPRDLGVIRNRWILAALGMTERWIYRSSAAVTAIGDHFAREIRRRGGTDTDVHTIPNFVDTAWISPRPKRNALAEEWGVADRPVLLYAGNLGLTQDFDLLLDTATKLPEVELVIVGAGARQADLERELERRDLPNVRLEPYQPEERVADLYGLADVVAVPLAAGHDRTTTPSKIFAAMAASRPIVVCAAVDTDLAQQVTSARAGTVVPPGDLRAFVAAVRSFVSGPSLDFDAGAALKEAESRSPRRVTAAYSALIDELVP